MAQPSPSPSPHRSPPRAAPEDPPLTPTPAQEERAAAAADDWQEEQMPPTPPHSTDVVVSAAAAKYVPPRAATHIAADAGAWYSWTGRAPRPSRASQSERARPPQLPPQQQPWEEQAPPRPPRQQPWEEAPPPPPRRTKTRPQPQPKPQPRQELPPHPPPAAAPPRVAAPPSPAPMPLPAPAPAPISSAERDRRVVPNILSRKRRAAVLQRSALVARGAAAGLCLAALAVLAADTRKGWALDSYSRYTQLRYSEAVNVIGFLYSLFQFVALAELMRRNKHLIPRPKGDYFDFFMDQVLAYLLISSSSSATARTGDWIDNWGSDPFPTMANSSIAISFLAFLVFAINALISAYNLFRRDL